MTLPALRDATLTQHGRYAILQFNRDDIMNALTGSALIDDICDTIDWANRHHDLSCLILTGAGRAFSAGGNVKDMRDKTGMFSGDANEIAQAYRHGIQRISKAVFNAEVVTIAAVNGPAIGAGFDLCCMCDLRLGSERCRFGETFINLGLIPGDGGGWFLQRLLGYQRAAELTFTGRVIDADEALSLGLLLEKVASDELISRAEAIAADIASKPPLTLRHSKRLLKQAQRQELADHLDNCATVQAQCHSTEDHALALNAFFAKTPATYKGK